MASPAEPGETHCSSGTGVSTLRLLTRAAAPRRLLGSQHNAFFCGGVFFFLSKLLGEALPTAAECASKGELRHCHNVRVTKRWLAEESDPESLVSGGVFTPLLFKHTRCQFTLKIDTHI